MEILILGWYIITRTGAVLLLTVYGSLQYVGTLIAPLFGMAGIGWAIATCRARCEQSTRRRPG
jgi:hypothetical protein